MTRLSAATLAATALATSPGCITLFSKTEVLRGDEARRPVRFESPEVATTFHDKLKKLSGEQGGTYVGAPFVTVYAKRKTVSEAGKFNDAVARCDTDQDGTITQAEATIFAQTGDE